MADAKLVWDMDTGPAEKKADALGKKLQGLGDKAPDFNKSIKGLGEMVAKATALTKALQAVAQGYTDASDAAAGNAKTAGGARLDRDLNLKRLGLGQSGNALIEGATGAASIEERDALLTSLAAKGVDKPTATKALRLGASGLFSNKEVMEGAEGGTLDALLSQQGQRLGALSPLARREYDTRVGESAATVAKAQAAGDFGFSSRRAQSAQELARLEDPVAGAIAGAVPGQDIRDAVERGAFQVVDAIKSKDKLNLSAGTEGAR